MLHLPSETDLMTFNTERLTEYSLWLSAYVYARKQKEQLKMHRVIYVRNDDEIEYQRTLTNLEVEGDFHEESWQARECEIEIQKEIQNDLNQQIPITDFRNILFPKTSNSLCVITTDGGVRRCECGCNCRECDGQECDCWCHN